MAESCKTKYTNLRLTLREINMWRQRSRVHWDNIKGANIAEGDLMEQDWKVWIEKQPTMHQFKTKGWINLDTMEMLCANDLA
ncbi:hypothetical protein J3A83DRAFT_4376531 [Scleroderma citrinum]